MKKQKFTELAQDVSDEDFKDFVGLKAYNFLNAKEKLMAGNNKGEFSWPAFVFHAFYAAYYKYWTPMLSLIIGALAIIIFVENPEKQESYSKLFVLALSIFWGQYFKTFYLKHAYKRISRLKKMEEDPDRLKVLLGKKGGTSILHLIFSLFLGGFAGLLLFAAGN